MRVHNLFPARSIMAIFGDNFFVTTPWKTERETWSQGFSFLYSVKFYDLKQKHINFMIVPDRKYACECDK